MGVNHKRVNFKFASIYNLWLTLINLCLVCVTKYTRTQFNWIKMCSEIAILDIIPYPSIISPNLNILHVGGGGHREVRSKSEKGKQTVDNPRALVFLVHTHIKHSGG